MNSTKLNAACGSALKAMGFAQSVAGGAQAPDHKRRLTARIRWGEKSDSSSRSEWRKATRTPVLLQVKATRTVRIQRSSRPEGCRTMPRMARMGGIILVGESCR